MYTPKQYAITDEDEALAFMQQYSFATIVNATNNIPEATHLPFLVEKRNGKIILSSHFAKANPQSAVIEDNTTLVIFTEPHAYISPSHYEKQTEVPTWNYVAVHTYGKVTLLNTDEEKLRLLQHTINFYEPGYLEQWNGLPDKFRSGLLQGIVAFEIEVNDLQGKKKLSQNKTENERQNIISTLKGSSHTHEQDVAGYMSNQ